MTARPDPAPAASVVRLPSWAERNQAWLADAIARLAERIARPAAGSEVPDSVEPAPPGGFVPALLHCAELFGLSPFERELLLLVAGVELDDALRSAAGGVASFALALATLTQPHWSALSPDAPLRYWRLILPDGAEPVLEARLRIDERVLHHLAGVPASDERLLGVATLLPTSEVDAQESDAALAERIGAALSAASPPAILLPGSDQDFAARRALVLAALSRVGRHALWVPARNLPNDPEAQALLARHLDREAALCGAISVLSVGAGGEAAAAFVARLRGPFAWLGPTEALHGAGAPDRRLLRFDLPPPDPTATRKMLARRLDGIDAGEAMRAALDRAAVQFLLGPAALDTIAEEMAARPPADRAAAIWPAARAAARGGLDALARRVVSRSTFADIVLPAGHMTLLHDIVRHLRHRERVYRDWGFGEKQESGQGLVALFAGESGTGKTLAAEAIAGAVDLDLYRVDLATLVSKYIGETEKNLKALFDAAEASGAVLLFDEADALFGKRSDVKDSHDRYANIEVAYLLQRIEAYRGLAVLTTNMKSAIDRAFLRRIRFVVSFPVPDRAAREQIWRRQFPERAPLGQVDFAALAALHLSGGNIRSIAVNAAFKAAEAGSAIDQDALIAAARDECAKLERSTGGLPGGVA